MNYRGTLLVFGLLGIDLGLEKLKLSWKMDQLPDLECNFLPKDKETDHFASATSPFANKQYVLESIKKAPCKSEVKDWLLNRSE